jgi:hypothetical protein
VGFIDRKGGRDPDEIRHRLPFSEGLAVSLGGSTAKPTPDRREVKVRGPGREAVIAPSFDFVGNSRGLAR